MQRRDPHAEVPVLHLLEPASRSSARRSPDRETCGSIRRGTGSCRGHSRDRPAPCGGSRCRNTGRRATACPNFGSCENSSTISRPPGFRTRNASFSASGMRVTFGCRRKSCRTSKVRSSTGGPSRRPRPSQVGRRGAARQPACALRTSIDSVMSRTTAEADGARLRNRNAMSPVPPATSSKTLAARGASQSHHGVLPEPVDAHRHHVVHYVITSTRRS